MVEAAGVGSFGLLKACKLLKLKLRLHRMHRIHQLGDPTPKFDPHVFGYDSHLARCAYESGTLSYSVFLPSKLNF
jgi:hypothetical protein